MARNYSDYYGLIFGCPMGTEVDSCIYKEIRSRPLSERLQTIISKSKDERAILVQHHKHCIAHRENKVPFSRIAIL